MSNDFRALTSTVAYIGAILCFIIGVVAGFDEEYAKGAYFVAQAIASTLVAYRHDEPRRTPTGGRDADG